MQGNKLKFGHRICSRSGVQAKKRRPLHKAKTGRKTGEDVDERNRRKT